MRPSVRRFARIALVVLAIGLALSVGAAYWVLNPQALKARAEQGLTARLCLPVTM